MFNTPPSSSDFNISAIGIEEAIAILTSGISSNSKNYEVIYNTPDMANTSGVNDNKDKSEKTNPPSSLRDKIASIRENQNTPAPVIFKPKR